jgi:preprotein translocase subunit SecA
MSLFDFLSGKKTREPDKIWMHESGKMKGLVLDIQACLGRREPVLVAAFQQASLDALAAELARSGVPHRVVKSSAPPSPLELWSAAEARLYLWAMPPRAFTKAVLGAVPVPDAKTLWILAVEHHTFAEHDQMLLDYAAALPGRIKVRFYGALDDPLLKTFGTERLMPLMQGLGLTEDSAIESSLVTRQIIAAQAKAAADRKRGLAG